jgi:putative ABC transport system permease protein
VRQRPGSGSRLWLRVLVRLRDHQTFASAEQALRGVQPQIRQATVSADAPPESKAKYLVPPFRNTVSPGWFATYGTRLVKGRDFDDRDRSETVPVVIVNERFVRKFMPSGNPIGRRVRNADPPANEQAPWWQVVGVAADAAYVSLREDVPPRYYLPLAQQRQVPALLSLSVRAANGPPALLVRSIADAIGHVDREITATFTPLKLDAALIQERLVAMLSGFFGALALLLAGLGCMVGRRSW